MAESFGSDVCVMKEVGICVYSSEHQHENGETRQ